MSFYLVLMMLISCMKMINGVRKYELDIRSCDTVENNEFVVYRLNCRYEGEGLYLYLGPDSVEKLYLDRLTDSSTLKIVKGHLKYIIVDECTGLDCCNSIVGIDISAMDIRIAGKTCYDQSTQSHSWYGETLLAHQGTTHHRTVAPDVHQQLTVESQTDDRPPPKTTTPREYDYTHQSTSSDHYSPTDSTDEDDTTPWIISTVATLTDKFQVLLVSLITLAIVLENVHRNLQNVVVLLRHFHPDRVRALFNPLLPQPPVPAPLLVQPPPVIPPIPAQLQQPRRSTRQRKPPNRLNL